MKTLRQTSADMLPTDAGQATLVGRVWQPEVNGPTVVKIEDGKVIDISSTFPTISDLCEVADPAWAVRSAKGAQIAELDALLDNTPDLGRDDKAPYLLAPVDLQAIKAAGVTFAVSMLERVIEEKARGVAEDAMRFRNEIESLVGADLSALKPGSAEAMALKAMLIEKGAWSQYLEVGIGPDAEIFTKAQPMSSVGTGAVCGLHPKSKWNNPEPEVALAISSKGKIVGAMLGNDVNLRDVEGRSALLLGKAKDNNASSSLGPLLRLFDSDFSLDDVRKMDIEMVIEGRDGFRLEGRSSLRKISRDPEDLVGQTIGAHHQYPDGAVLFLGTMFAPIQDRYERGSGFTHEYGDVVSIATPRLGQLVNEMQATDACAPWEFGTRALMRNLAVRGLLTTSHAAV